MSLSRPVLNQVAAFDATFDAVFTFAVYGGDQVVANTLTIKDNASLTQVYSETQTSFKLIHTVPANTLENGHYYQATVVTKNAAGEESKASIPIQFNCYSTPTFELTNIHDDMIVNNSSFSFAFSYNQNEGEILNSYEFVLFDQNGEKISSSGTMYNTASGLPFTASYTFAGLSNNTSYKIKVNGATAGKTIISTDTISFVVKYSEPTMYSYLYLTNNCLDGTITVETKINAIGGTSYPEEPTYIDGKEIDLTGDGHYVEWESGYSVSQPFTLRIWGRNFKPDSDVLIMKNKNGGSVVVSYHEDDESAWWQLRATMKNWTNAYTIMSDKIAKPTTEEQVFMWLRCKLDLYDLVIENRGVVV